MKPIIETIQKQLTMSFEEGVVKAVQEVGIVVDKERLEKALYDAKSFYEEGYKDGAAASPPTAHGEWIESSVPESMLCECSLCHFPCGAYSHNFCPNCGAKMDGGKQNV